MYITWIFIINNFEITKSITLVLLNIAGQGTVSQRWRCPFPSVQSFMNYIFIYLFKSGFHCVALAVLELTM